MGGALALDDQLPASNIVITSSTFSTNTAPNVGSAINDGGGRIAITESLFESNTGDDVIYFQGGVVGTLTNDTIIANTGMGVATNNGASVTLINDTIVGNTCNPICYDGAGISQNSGGMLTVRNSIVAHNIDLAAGALANFRAAGTMTSLGNNLTDSAATDLPFAASAGDLVLTDPQLAPLADNGGPTRTAAITTSSPAYNAGTNTQCAPIDQRGFPRPAGGICDIGAFELQ